MIIYAIESFALNHEVHLLILSPVLASISQQFIGYNRDFPGKPGLLFAVMRFISGIH